MVYWLTLGPVQLLGRGILSVSPVAFDACDVFVVVHLSKMVPDGLRPNEVIVPEKRLPQVMVYTAFCSLKAENAVRTKHSVWVIPYKYIKYCADFCVHRLAYKRNTSN